MMSDEIFRISGTCSKKENYIVSVFFFFFKQKTAYEMGTTEFTIIVNFGDASNTKTFTASFDINDGTYNAGDAYLCKIWFQDEEIYFDEVNVVNWIDETQPGTYVPTQIN